MKLVSAFKLALLKAGLKLRLLEQYVCWDEYRVVTPADLIIPAGSSAKGSFVFSSDVVIAGDFLSGAIQAPKITVLGTMDSVHITANTVVMGEHAVITGASTVDYGILIQAGGARVRAELKHHESMKP